MTASISGLRRSELLFVTYFTYTSLVALLLPLDFAVQALTIVVNAAVIGAYVALGKNSRYLRHDGWRIVRDWLPLALIVLAYRQMGWFAPSEHTFELERSWVAWDRLLLNNWGLREAIESLGPLLPSVLEVSYALVYAIGPFGVAVLYACGRRDQVDRFLFLFVLGTVLSYALFPYFPSEPPRAVFPGQDSPTIDTVFRGFNWWLLSGGGIHTSVFPSGHVSAAFAAAFAMWRVLPRRRWISWLLGVLAVLIAVATVYGRYHYAVDVVAGLAVSLVALGFVALVERRLGNR